MVVNLVTPTVMEASRPVSQCNNPATDTRREKQMDSDAVWWRLKIDAIYCITVRIMRFMNSISVKSTDRPIM